MSTAGAWAVETVDAGLLLLRLLLTVVAGDAAVAAASLACEMHHSVGQRQQGSASGLW